MQESSQVVKFKKKIIDILTSLQVRWVTKLQNVFRAFGIPEFKTRDYGPVNEQLISK